ncbi:MAG: lysylphosphatidylglycerol synthase domain-containing protein [Candidatus Cloacimonetes bacterium]|nr:lysylphosphatidylglycerol synthase domain-containing protein [Candidatus Cloacimonadota bacterium]
MYSIIKQKLLRYKIYIQIAVSILVLVIIFRKIEIKTILSILFSLDISLLLMLLGISLIKFLSQAINWHNYIKIFSFKKDSYTFLTVLKTHTIGLALRFLLPGGYATLGKVYYLDSQRKKDTFFSIVLEKFFIIWIIWFFALWVMFFRNKIIFINDVFNNNVYFIILFLSIIITILPFFLPKLFKKFIDKYVKRNFYKYLPNILILQFIFEILTFVLYFITLQSLTSVNLNFFDVSAFVAIILVANTIPITFSGLGLRELASGLFLPRLGVPVEIAVSTSLIIYLINSVLPAIFGAFLIASHKKKEANNENQSQTNKHNLKNYLNKMFFINNTFLKKIFFYKKIRFAVHLTDHCNLNCKGCNHFSPLSEEHFLDVEKYESDCRKFSSIASNKVKLIKLLGGEPLLHKEIVRLIEITRKYFSQTAIELWTNGILLVNMPQQFFECCAKNKVLISITPYPIKLDFDKINEIKEKYKVRIVKDKTTFHLTQKFRRYTLDLNGSQDAKNNFIRCRSSHCSTLRDGKYYLCNTAAYIDIFNHYFNENLEINPKDYIDIYTIEDLNPILNYRKNPIPFCRYCKVSDFNVFEIWDISKKDISEWV